MSALALSLAFRDAISCRECRFTDITDFTDGGGLVHEVREVPDFETAAGNAHAICWWPGVRP